MTEPVCDVTDAVNGARIRLPSDLACAGCDVPLADRFGWCGNCRAALCLACGRAHFCTPGCAAAGCRAGLCVRLVEHGVMSPEWGLPPDRSEAATSGP